MKVIEQGKRFLKNVSKRDKKDGIPLKTYIDHLVSLINTRPGYDIKVTGKTVEEKAESLIKELCRVRIFKSV